MLTQLKIAVITYHQTEKAQALAKQLNIPTIKQYEPEFEFTLHYTAEGLQLNHYKDHKPQTLIIDFLSAVIQHRLKTSGKNQPLAKAIGLKVKTYPQVLDMTAGLGRDAFLLAALGCQVTLMEQSPIIAALLADAIARARCAPETKDIAERMNLLVGDSRTLLPLLKTKPDVIYLDPMFPQRNKSALVKKDMQILQALLGHDNTPETLLKSALIIGSKRVVVKRPKLAGFIGDKAPKLQIKSKTHRFDVYL